MHTRASRTHKYIQLETKYIRHGFTCFLDKTQQPKKGTQKSCHGHVQLSGYTVRLLDHIYLISTPRKRVLLSHTKKKTRSK